MNKKFAVHASTLGCFLRGQGELGRKLRIDASWAPMDEKANTDNQPIAQLDSDNILLNP